MPALGLDFERSLRAQPSDVRRALSTALRDAGFQLTAEQLTRVEAKRGSRFLGGALMPPRMMPILAWFDIAADAGGCTVAGHLADQHLNLGGKAWGWNQTYRQLFDEILAAVDTALARVDPGSAGQFGPGRFWSRGGEIAVLEQTQSRGVQAGAAVFGKANELLEGGARDRGPAAWKGVDSVTFASPKGFAVLSLAETQGHLGVGMILASQPGSLPPNLLREVEQFAGRVEAALTNAPGRAVTIQVAEAEQPVFDFLHQQVRIRDGLPVRTLHTCRTCQFQRVTNEDFARLQARTPRLRNIVGGVGATISSGGIQPFVIFGQLFKLKKLDPDYVCPRCQGLDAAEAMVTFCPSCGDLRSEAVLRVCAKCTFDFRGALARESLWLSADAAAAAVAPPADGGTHWQVPGPAPVGGPAAATAPRPTWAAPAEGPAPGPAPKPEAAEVPRPPWAAPAQGPGPGWGASAAPPDPARPTWTARVGERLKRPWVAGAGTGTGWGVPSVPGARTTPGTGSSWGAQPVPGAVTTPPPAAPPPAAPLPAAPPPAAPPPAAPPTAIDGGAEPDGSLAAAPTPAPPVDASATDARPVAPAPRPMSFCPYCGSRTDQQFAFCPRCGARLDTTAQAQGRPRG
jgi:hypothetical protein